MPGKDFSSESIRHWALHDLPSILIEPWPLSKSLKASVPRRVRVRALYSGSESSPGRLHDIHNSGALAHPNCTIEYQKHEALSTTSREPTNKMALVVAGWTLLHCWEVGICWILCWPRTFPEARKFTRKRGCSALTAADHEEWSRQLPTTSAAGTFYSSKSTWKWRGAL